MFLTTDEAAPFLTLTTRMLDCFRTASEGAAYYRFRDRVYCARVYLLSWVSI